MSLALIILVIQSEEVCSQVIFSVSWQKFCRDFAGPVPWRHSLFQDTEVIVWDVINESGLYRLRGHKDVITQVLFSKEKNLLVTW